MRSVVLPQVVEYHHGPGRPVEVRVQDVGEVPQFGGGGPTAHDGPVFLLLIEAERGTSGSDQREFPMGRETTDGCERVHTPGAEKSIRAHVKLGVHSDDLRTALGAGARNWVLGAVVQDVDVAVEQQPFTPQVFVRHPDGWKDTGQSPRVLVVVIWEHHCHSYVTCAAREEATGQHSEQAASQRASASHVASQPLGSAREKSMATECAPFGEERHGRLWHPDAKP